MRMLKETDVNDIKALLDIRDDEEDGAAIVVTSDEDEGTTVFEQGDADSLVVCIAAAVQHLSEFSGERPRKILANVMEIVQIMGGRKLTIH